MLRSLSHRHLGLAALVLFLLCSGAAGAQPRLFALPGDNSGQIVELDPTTLAEIHRIPAPIAPQFPIEPVGLGFDGTSLFFVFTVQGPAGTHAPASVYELDPDTGAVLDADVVPGEYIFLDGIGIVDGLVYLLQVMGGQEGSYCTRIHRFDPVADTFAEFWVAPCLYGGLAGITNPSALIGSSTWDQTIYEINPSTGAVVSSFPSPQGLSVFAVGVVEGEIFVGGSSAVQARPASGYSVHGDRAPSQYAVFSRAGQLLRSGTLPWEVSAFGADDLGERPSVIEIPTLSITGLLALALAISVAAIVLGRRRRAA